MPRLIFKCHHLKSGGVKSEAHRRRLVSYIATREGVEKLEKPDKPATKKQVDMVRELVSEFPASTELPEYGDYAASQTQRSASEFISRALEDNMDQLVSRGKYLEYIAKRPRVQILGSHGLFNGTEDELALSKVADAVANHPGTVWLPIISLRREDAARLGYDNAESWRALLSGYAGEMAAAMKIPVEQFRWYAAFHDEGEHPHVHMACYSADGKSGFVTENGIAKIRSELARRIFRQELTELYTKQTQRRDELTQESRAVLGELISQMESGTLENQRIQELLLHLARQLRHTTGKKKYGYLKASLKSVVDEIVDELAKDPRVAEAYRLWYDLREDVMRTYKDTMPERVPLSRQKELKRIKNLVVEEADWLGRQIGTDEQTAITRKPTTRDMSVPLLRSVTRLLHHMSRVFREQTPEPTGGLVTHVDSKLRQKIREKKIAQGHKPDDHEEQTQQFQ